PDRRRHRRRFRPGRGVRRNPAEGPGAAGGARRRRRIVTVLLIDNYDSFPHNLARYIREPGRTWPMARYYSLSRAEVSRLAPSLIVVSPGPCSPNEAGVSNAVIARFGGTVPLLGVCLGHQCIGQVFGGRVVRAKRPMHGKTSLLRHRGDGIFAGL